MVKLLVVPCLFFGLALYTHISLRGQQGAMRWLLFLGCVAGAGMLPWLLPSEWGVERLAVAMGGALACMRMADVAWARYPDPKMQENLGRFLLAFFSPADMRWVEPGSARDEIRAQGRARIGRGLLKGLGFVGLVLLGSAWEAVHDIPVLSITWVIWWTYFSVTAVVDIVSGLLMQTGFRCEEVFDVPPLASSPRDFWSRRWNMIFRNASHRLIFAPLKGHERPALGVCAVFLWSAVMHEYIIIAALGTTGGHMTAFFALHCAATLFYGALKRRHPEPLMPKGLAVALHLAWFTATAPLFFAPMIEILNIHAWRISLG